ncbi:unnamed protein product [Amaranthus hypochondriacus]
MDLSYEWERKNPMNTTTQKQKMRFMRKYFHKGTFFQPKSDDRAGIAPGNDMFRRDFSAPTGDDKLNRTIFPEVMQVNHFVKSGRTIWTHLVNEDTTDLIFRRKQYKIVVSYPFPYFDDLAF